MFAENAFSHLPVNASDDTACSGILHDWKNHYLNRKQHSHGSPLGRTVPLIKLTDRGVKWLERIWRRRNDDDPVWIRVGSADLFSV